MARYLYSELSSLIQARKNCASRHPFTTEQIKSHCALCGEIDTHANHNPRNPEWFDKHTDSIEELVRQHMPSGSGFDSGTTLDLDASHAEKLVFRTSFHHMDEGGYYDGWTYHTVTVTPSLSGQFNLRISGRNRNDIKDYMYETFSYALGKEVRIPDDPFKDVADYWQCVRCYGAASCTVNGKRYCEGCGKYHAD